MGTHRLRGGWGWGVSPIPGVHEVPLHPAALSTGAKSYCRERLGDLGDHPVILKRGYFHSRFSLFIT